MLLYSDYGYELKENDCVAAAWFDANIPVHDCEFGERIDKSTG
jgi:hypothetical protein